MSRAKPRKNAPKATPKAGVTPEVAKDDLLDFGTFRKHHKIVLWITVVLTVIAFGLVSSWGDVAAYLGGQGPATVATFVVPETGAKVEVQNDVFNRTTYSLRRLNPQAEITEDDVLRHIMLVADAGAAGLEVSNAELAERLASLGIVNMTKAQYREVVIKRLAFASVSAFETLLREQLLMERYVDFRVKGASIIDADELYLRWRVDNERFDYTALVFADTPLDEVADPTDEELQSWYDEMPVPIREARFRDPAKKDIVVGWISLETDEADLSAEAVGRMEEPTDAKLTSRFNLVKSARFPDAEELTDEIRAQMRAEVRLVDMVQDMYADFVGGETQDKETFVALVEAHGLTVLDPEGLLTPPEVAALEPVGTEQMASLVRFAPAGQTRFSRPYGAETVAAITFIEADQSPQPLTLEDSREAFVEGWKKEHQGKRARDFRDAITAAARETPEAAEEIAPLLAAAEARVEARIAAATEAGEEFDAEAIRTEENDAIEADILGRVAEFESQVWAPLAKAAEDSGAEVRTFEGISKGYARDPDPEEEAQGLERFLKTNPLIFQQSVDGVTPLLRHLPSQSSAVVLVTGRELPTKEEMFADPAGMADARQALGWDRRQAAYKNYTDFEVLKASHQLQVAKELEPKADDEDGEGQAP